MLDQNTDRMWYVIGAVLVGAAIILIANGTMPKLFASVTDSFSAVSDNAVDGLHDASGGISFDERVKLIEQRHGKIESDGINVLHEDTLTAHSLSTFDKSAYNSSGKVRIRTGADNYSGIRLQVSDFKNLEPNTVYTLSYNFRKVSDDDLLNMGGHVARDMRPFKSYINGSEYDYVYTDNEDDNIRNDDSTQSVVVHFTTTDSIDDPRDNRGIWIQPNRYERSAPVTIELTNLKVEKGMNVTPWSSYGK